MGYPLYFLKRVKREMARVLLKDVSKEFGKVVAVKGFTLDI